MTTFKKSGQCGVLVLGIIQKRQKASDGMKIRWLDLNW